MDVTIVHDHPRLDYPHVATQERARAVWDWLQAGICRGIAHLGYNFLPEYLRVGEIQR